MKSQISFRRFTLRTREILFSLEAPFSPYGRPSGALGQLT